MKRLVEAASRLWQGSFMELIGERYIVIITVKVCFAVSLRYDFRCLLVIRFSKKFTLAFRPRRPECFIIAFGLGL